LPFCLFLPFLLQFSLYLCSFFLSLHRFHPCSLLTVFFPPPVWHLLISVLQGSLYFTIYRYTTEVCIIITALNVNKFLIFWTNCVCRIYVCRMSDTWTCDAGWPLPPAWWQTLGSS
jgi:hypothetical protein